jgi:hypothetical protein
MRCWRKAWYKIESKTPVGMPAIFGHADRKFETLFPLFLLKFAPFFRNFQREKFSGGRF